MKKTLLIILIAVLAASLVGIAACRNNASNVSFDKAEYEISDGGKVSVTGGKNVTFKLLTKTDGVEINETTGIFTVANQVADCTQVIVAAVVNGTVADTAICRLRTASQAPAITFTNLSNYIVNGDIVGAVSTPAYSVSYSLLQDYAGISIDSVSGKVTFSGNVADGLDFTVVASAKGESSQKTFTTAVGNYVLAEDSQAIAEYQVGTDVSFVLNYQDNPEAEQIGVLAVMNGHSRLNEADWSYDRVNRKVTINSSYTKTLFMGDAQLKIITSKNAVAVSVNVAKYVATAEDLAAIDDTVEALAGNYVMVCDIDLTEYLSVSGAGYNNGKGWTPIGTYFDTRVGAETEWAFCGTFDGNGHTVSGFFINRSDDYAYNSGFFGYIASQGVVKNLGVKNGENQVNNVRSYSGGFAGVNVGKIINCWADVDVITGEVFKVVGGFVGRNEGEITNCYSLGRVSAGSEVGSFAGVSRTPISLGSQNNCYAVQTGSYPFSNDYNDTCKTVATKNDLISCDFSAYTDGWDVQSGQLPVLKSVSIDYSLRELRVTSDRTYAVSGDTFTLKVSTNPAKDYDFTFERVEGRGVRVDANGVINTNNVQFGSSGEPIRCVIKVTCQDMSALYEFYVYDQVQSISFADTMETTLYAGNYYKIDTVVEPIAANRQVKYTLVKGLKGVSLSGDGILALSDNIVADGEIIVRATASDGQHVCERTLSVVANKRFDGNYCVIYREQTDNVRFTLPEHVAAVNKVTRYDKEVEFTLVGNTVTIDRKYFVDFEDKEIPVKLVTGDGTYIAAVVAYDEADVYEIGSVADFMKYKADFMTDPELRTKTVILTADLDFEGATITSIGSHHVGADFLGVFNGNGHTVSNLKIDRNEFSGAYTSEEGVNRPDESSYPFHASRYNVGLFSYVKGTVSNVNFVNVHVANYFSGTYTSEDGRTTVYEKEAIGNFLGVVAGTVEGVVSNCTFSGCTVKGGDIKGVICGKDSATVVNNCLINGELYEK